MKRSMGDCCSVSVLSMINNVKIHSKTMSPLTRSFLKMILIDFTLSNTTQFYTSIANTLGVNGLTTVSLHWQRALVQCY